MSKIIVGVSGSIAAYKIAHLIRLLIRNGDEVRVIMTPSAAKFISPLTLSTLSKNEVMIDLMDDGSWNNHVELGLWADAMVIAPATATTIGKLANGIADNMLVATYLSAKCPVYIAPAMDLDMWRHPSTKSNIKKLQSFGNHLINVGSGELASGLHGEGRMEEPEKIVEILGRHDNIKNTASTSLAGKKILITAGPTHEKIDAVRFISNKSTGKMGIAIAETCADYGAKVALVLGPTKVKPVNKDNIEVVNIVSAQDMYNASIERYGDVDIAIFTAAVADYTPNRTFDHKVKKSSGDWEMKLNKTKDIAAALGEIKQPHQLNIGFALETNNEVEFAKGKLKKKSFDFIVLNSLADKGAGFGHDTNKVTIIHKDGSIKEHALKSKYEVAEDVIQEILKII